MTRLNQVPILSPIEPAFTSSVFRNAPIGVMDSGVGGLSVLNHLREQMPHEDFIFIADQANVPYGPRSNAEIHNFVDGIVRFFIVGHAKQHDPLYTPTKLIVVACNTATSAALNDIRAAFPQIKFVGVEPGLKPAILQTTVQKVGVIATQSTLNNERFAHLMNRFAQEVEVFTKACPELVDLVERGGIYTPEDRQLVCDLLQPLVASGIDQLVLGCTHFPFLLPLIQDCVSDSIEIIDSGPAVARHALHLLQEYDALTDRTTLGRTIYATTGDLDHFKQQLDALLDEINPMIRQLQWQHNALALPE